MNRTKFIQEYLDRGFSLIPLKNNSKLPVIRWKKYQYKRASLEEIFNWFITFSEPNIGLVTGGKLIVIDVDDPSKLPELFKRLPEAEKTTRVKTKRCCHFYFSNNEHKIKSTKNLFNLGIELHAEGRQMVGPPSKIDGFTYNFEIPLSEIKPLPNIIIESLGEKEGYQAPGVEYKNRRVLELPYHGQKVDCIRQVLSRDLEEGERNNSLYILFNLLLQNKNKEDYSRDIVRNKNLSLTKPLSQKEVENIFKKVYNHRCSSIIEMLPYIKCESCEFKFKGGKFKMSNPIIHNLRRLGELEAGEQRVLLFLGSYFQGEKPLQSEIIKVSRLSKSTVIRAMKGLREKQFINY